VNFLTDTAPTLLKKRTANNFPALEQTASLAAGIGVVGECLDGF
jgi:hypothetical protein